MMQRFKNIILVVAILAATIAVFVLFFKSDNGASAVNNDVNKRSSEVAKPVKELNILPLVPENTKK